MIAWLLVPLQYLFMRWRAENILGRAQKAKGYSHGRLMDRGRKAVAAVEAMQLRFPAVTDRIDEKLRRHAQRERIAS